MQRDPQQAGRSRHHRAFQRQDAADALLADDSKRLRAVLRGQAVPEADVEAYLALLGTRETLDAAIHWYRAAPGSDSALLGARVPPVRVPTLYLWGDQDATVGRHAAEATAEYVTGSYEFRVIPGAGHFLTDQEPQVVSDELLRHLQRHS